MSESIENILNELVRATTRQYDQFDRNNERLLSNSELLKTLVEKVVKLDEQVSGLTKAQSDSKEEIKYLREKLNVASSALVEQNKNFHEREQTCVNMVKSMMEKMDTFEKPRVKKPVNTEPRRQCKCFTKKGIQCKKYCIDGSDMCKQHTNISLTNGDTSNESEPPCDTSETDIREESENTVVKKPDGRKRRKPAKKKIPPPVHNHEPGESSQDCELCTTHGDILDPDMPDEEFTGVDVDGMTLEDRLRMVIQEEEGELMSNISNTSTDIKQTTMTFNEQSWADMLEEEEELQNDPEYTERIKNVKVCYG
tara:strand:+ start:1608 stop:2537 length:930 start_codon:yes stop_codon:yes gene_type:complete